MIMPLKSLKRVSMSHQWVCSNSLSKAQSSSFSSKLLPAIDGKPEQMCPLSELTVADRH